MFDYYFLGFVTAKVQEGMCFIDAFRDFKKTAGLSDYEFTERQAQQKWRYLTQKRMTGEICL